MSTCEKCWRESASLDGDHAERYSALIDKRAEKPCTPEEQAGPEAERCETCGRMVRHQYSGECMAGCSPSVIREASKA